MVVHIPDIQCEFFFPTDRISPVHLCQTRYPRPDIVAADMSPSHRQIIIDFFYDFVSSSLPFGFAYYRIFIGSVPTNVKLNLSCLFLCKVDGCQDLAELLKQVPVI